MLGFCKPLPMVGPFELNVLGAIRHLGQDVFGSKVRVFLSQEFGRDVAIGQVYVTLGRLQRRGFISAKKETLGPHQSGRAKLVFQLEAPGKKALEFAMAAAGVSPRNGELNEKQSEQMAEGVA
jgi:PadR family transcriptional regulator, regulatory protein PadR